MGTTVTSAPAGRPRWRPAVVGWVLVALVAAVAGLLAGATPADAHASVRATTPADGARLSADEVPSQVTIEFNEPVETAPDAIRVVDEAGDRVDVDGDVAVPDDHTVARMLGPLDDGGYIVTWAVTSADGHPLRGAFVFTVGGGAGPSDEVVASVFGGGAGVVGPAQVAVTGATYVAVLLAAGAVLTAAVLRRRSTAEGRWVRTAAVAGIVATVLVLPLQAAAASGDGLAAALAPAQLLAVVTGSVGIAAFVRIAGLALVVGSRGPLRVAGAVVALASFLVDGHTRTVEPTAVVVTADALHLLAAAVWFGGLALLALQLRQRRLADDPVGGARLVRDWSRLATVAVVGVLVAGTALSWATVRSPDALSTAYGTTLMVKVALALLVVALGAYNHFRVVPAVERAVVVVPAGGAGADGLAVVPDGAHDDVGAPPTATARTEAGWQRLGAVVRLEVLLLVLVLAVTGWLQGQRPAAEELGIGGPLVASEPLTDDLTLDLVVDPNVAGVNTIHAYLLDETGRTVAGVEEVTLRLSLPEREIAPIERVMQVAGPGHWTVTGRELALPGTWEIDATVRIDAFTERSVTVRTVVAAP